MRCRARKRWALAPEGAAECFLAKVLWRVSTPNAPVPPMGGPLLKQRWAWRPLPDQVQRSE